MEYEFTFVVDGLAADDDNLASALAEDFDAMVMWHRGSALLVMACEGGNAVDAVQTLLPKLAAAYPSVRLRRLDPELVGVADIAERVCRSRQNVQQWVDGDRQAQAEAKFPSPEGTVGRSLAWRWADVNAWLKLLGLDDGEERPSRTEAVIIDVVLLQWQQALDDGELVLKFLVAGDEHAGERQVVLSRVTQAMSDPGFKAGLAAWPRDNQHQLAIVCAVPFDPLKVVIEQLGTERSGILAVMTDDLELHVTPIASVKLPWTSPISDLGLSDNATVGDLILMQRSGTVPTRPLALP